MFGYNARPWHVIWTIVVLFLGTEVIALSEHWAWITCGILIWLVGIGMFYWMIHAGTHDSSARYIDAVANLAQVFDSLDQETRDAMGIRFPSLRIRYRGKTLSYLEDTDILMNYFYEFINASSEKETVPERAYGDGTIARKQWRLWISWLIENGYVMKNSASGNHSFLFYGGARQRLIERYGRGKALINLSEAERGSNPTNMEYLNDQTKPA